MKALFLAPLLMLTLRAAGDGVSVPVSVRDGTLAVTGLTASDFVLTDNEVPQQITTVSVESMPIDVTLIVGASDDLQQISRLLRPQDALRVLRIGSVVEELRPMSPVTGGRAGASIARMSGYSSVHDALVAGLIRPVAANRSHLVVAITDALDTMSFTTADRVREVAARSEAVLEILTVRPPVAYRPRSGSARPRYNDQDVLILTEAAESTGGDLRGRGVFADPNPVSAFKKVFDDFRQSYLLKYTPREVELGGWHELSVTLPTSPNLIVRARKGYPGS